VRSGQRPSLDSPERKRRPEQNPVESEAAETVQPLAYGPGYAGPLWRKRGQQPHQFAGAMALAGAGFGTSPCA
jgi:hypothetical protein